MTLTFLPHLQYNCFIRMRSKSILFFSKAKNWQFRFTGTSEDSSDANHGQALISNIWFRAHCNFDFASLHPSCLGEMFKFKVCAYKLKIDYFSSVGYCQEPAQMIYEIACHSQTLVSYEQILANFLTPFCSGNRTEPYKFCQGL